MCLVGDGRGDTFLKDLKDGFVWRVWGQLGGVTVGGLWSVFGAADIAEGKAAPSYGLRRAPLCLNFS